MSTRLTKKEATPNSVATGYEGDNVPEDFSLPACTIEDVDRALFNLFDKVSETIKYSLIFESFKISILVDV